MPLGSVRELGTDGSISPWYQGSMERIRVSVDVSRELRRKIRLAASRQDVTINDYIREAVTRKVTEDLVEVLHAGEDPVLAELWDNPDDDVYDHL